jgi:hypothetical protein
LKINSEIIKLSDEIAMRSVAESECFPIDRLFLNQYINQILLVDRNQFILYNINRVNPTYTRILFLCLPELWEQIELDEIDEIADNFTNAFSFYTLIEFTYRYLEIDILERIIDKSIVKGFYSEVKKYLLLQWDIIIKSEDEIQDLTNGFERDYYQYDVERWLYIKQRFLLDNRIQPAIQEYNYVKNRVNKLIR